jgi:hypothetical protein
MVTLNLYRVKEVRGRMPHPNVVLFDVRVGFH